MDAGQCPLTKPPVAGRDILTELCSETWRTVGAVGRLDYRTVDGNQLLVSGQTSLLLLSAQLNIYMTDKPACPLLTHFTVLY